MQRTIQKVLIATLLVGLWLPAAGLAETETPPAPGSALPLEQLRIFAEVYGRIRSDYVEEVNERELLQQAIKGMLAGLDPHSSYLSEDEFDDLRVGTSGEFGGLGIEVGLEDGFVKVIAPIDDTPAARAGIQSGDLIVRIDGEPIKGLSLDDAVKRMRGEPGSEVVLTIVRETQDAPLEIVVVRDVIKVASVRERWLAPGFAYLRLAQFQARTPDDMLAALRRLAEEDGSALQGLVLDLRDNPGGILNAAVSVSDAFLTGGTIVYTKGRVSDSELSFEASPDDVIDGAAIVVLVNEGSASASEIVAGALQDHKRAVIMGRRTFGKGSVQTIIPITEKTAVKLTTARYYTPLGRSIQAEGIVPDITLRKVTVAADDEEVREVSEADLAGHLANPNGEGAADAEADAAADLLAEDYELNEALNLLKGLAILRPGAR